MTVMQELMDMGYTEREAKKALHIAGGDIEQAVGYLLMGDHSRKNLVGSFRNSDNSSNHDASGHLEEESSNNNEHTASNHQPGAFAAENDQLQDLMQMGYSERAAREALRVANGDREQAINFLLMGESRAGFVTDRSSSLNFENDAAMAAQLQEEELRSTVVSPNAGAAAGDAAAAHPPQSDSSMYHGTSMRNESDIPRMVATEAYVKSDGASVFSACIAASKFSQGGVVTAAFLNEILEGAIELFRKNNSSTDWDVPKVIKKYGRTLRIATIPKALDPEEPKEGVFLAKDPNHTLGLRKQLARCRNQQGDGWQLLILELPHLVNFFIALPPKGTKNKFWYIDFYPRSCFRVVGAHARVHSTMLQLGESLETAIRGMLSSDKDYENFKIYTISKTQPWLD